MKKFFISFVLLVVISGSLCAGFDFSKIKNNISEFTISNGLKFILLEDHSVPVATFVTYVNVGGSDEKMGTWGISHFLEHMAFKGTSEVGTTNVAAEKKVLQKMDELFDQILAEKEKIQPDAEKIKKMEADLEKLRVEADSYVVPNEFLNILKENGVTGLNAGTSKDSTVYYYSLPSNRIELWAYLESARFSDPFFREFYKERGVIQEERRMRVENNPVGKLIEELLAVAYKDHSYHVNGIGPMSNISHITRADMYKYFNENYTAKNMVIGVAGDVTPDQLKKLAEKYFSKLKPGKRNPFLFTDETPQLGEKTVTLMEENTQPWLIIGYHAVAVSQPDFLKFNILNNILTNGRSSRLQKRMVIQEKTAMNVLSFAGLPGDKYPCLYLVGALPNSGQTTAKLMETIDSEIEKLKTEPVSEEEMNSAKTRLKISTINGMGSNQGILMSLLSAEVKQGSWQKVFDKIDAIEKITAADIQDLANKYLISQNRTIGRIEKKAEVKK